MSKKVILKRTEPAENDTILDVSENPDVAFIDPNGKYKVQYLCADCSKVQIKDMPLPFLQEKFKPMARLILKCSCGAHLLVVSVPPEH